MTYLLDVNVLIALFDPAHPFYHVAHQWLGTKHSDTWATCPMTECGFVRIVSNAAYRTVTLTSQEIAERLRLFCQRPDHVFWPDAISITDPSIFDLSQLRGHQQITDTYLAGMAFHYGGKLATFDANVPIAAVAGAKPSTLEVIAVP